MRNLFSSYSRNFACLTLAATVFVCGACSPKVAPYADGPVMSQKHIQQTFTPILKFMDLQPGMTFADVGAASGVFTVMMATLMNNSTVYVQDIDDKILRQDNLDKIVDFYSKQSKTDLRKTNRFVLTMGDANHSRLPDGAIDRIFSNATIHVFDSADSMMTDLRKKLKPTGMIFIRESFRKNPAAVEYCSDKKCGKPLLSTEEFLTVMKRNGYKLAKQSSDMSGYPVYGFALQ